MGKFVSQENGLRTTFFGQPVYEPAIRYNLKHIGFAFTVADKVKSHQRNSEYIFQYNGIGFNQPIISDQ